MKKIITLLIVVNLFICRVDASKLVMDMDSKRILYSEGKDEERLIASTTKIMTAMVVINNIDINTKVTVDQDVLRSFGSGIYIEIGEEITIKDLLYGLMLRSGNDAAIELANKVGGSEEGFTILMNELASSIGMHNTNFINASGLEDDKGNGNTSTPYDMALLMSYAMNNEIFKTITSTKHYVAKTNFKTYDWYNKNKLLTDYEYTTGGKTGYTKKAYRTLVTSATKDDKNLVVVTLNERDDFDIHKNLYNEYFKKYKRVKILDSSTFLREDEAYINNDVYMLLKDDEINNVKVEVIYTDDVTNRLGYVEVSLDDIVYFKEDIFIKELKEELTFWDKVKSFFTSLFN